MNKEDAFSKKRWDFLYNQTDKSIKDTKAYYDYLDKLGLNEFKHLKPFVIGKTGKALEIGCGMGACALQVKKHGWQTWGIDFSSDNLAGAKDYWHSRGETNHFVLGNITKLPFEDKSFDLIFGMGVLEHVFKTSQAVSEIYRVLKPGGVALNTVPAFSIASLTYRQLSGTIPEVPLLKTLFSFIHIKLLARKLMHTGYEKCFTKTYLLKIHKSAGFKTVSVSHDASFKPKLNSFPRPIKKLLINLEKSKPFWAWYYIAAIK
jgi:ubiquinone/menaquinone biosynthesis C-methylase UbiE